MGPRRRQVTVAGTELTVATWGRDTPSIVLLHDGLGSIDQWLDVPERLVAATGRSVLAYDRPGHGESTPTPVGPWPTDWLHGQAELFRRLSIEVGVVEPTLVGHSDGGSIALIALAQGYSAHGAVALAAHSYVEPVCVRAIENMRKHRDRVVQGLARHHSQPADLFEAWSAVWVSAEFGRWDLRPSLAAIEVPVLVAQGSNDEYATDQMATDTAAAIGDNADCVLLPRLGHLLHHRDPAAVVDLVGGFVNRT